jgi:hypothetical protein
MILEGDLMNVAAALHQEGLCWSRFGLLIEDIKIRLLSLQSVELRHTRWEANEAAHCLVKFALSAPLDLV